VTPAEEPTARVQEILEQRARALARAPAEGAPGDTVRLLVIEVGPERYGVELDRVREVSRTAVPSPVPGAPPEWAGLVNLRGNLHWVLNLRRYLGLEPGEAQGSGSLVLATAGGYTIGLLSDALPALGLVHSDDVRPAPAGWNGSHKGIIRGVTPDLVSVLDLGGLLNAPDVDARGQLS
jgi:purine-binding chemotaxis protein CheW